MSDQIEERIQELYKLAKSNPENQEFQQAVDVIKSIKRSRGQLQRHNSNYRDNLGTLNNELKFQKQENSKLRERINQFVDFNNSEILSTGKWLIHAFSKKGKDRSAILLEKDLVHKQDYNHAISDMRDAVHDMDSLVKDGKLESKERIVILENKNDDLRGQLQRVEDYIKRNYSVRDWNKIKSQLNIRMGK